MSDVYTDDDLRMIRLQEGDIGVFDEIVAAWQRPLFYFFLRNTRDQQLAEDLVQDTLLRLFRRAWDYLPTGRFRGWLFWIAHNLLIDHSRKRTNDVLIHSLRAADFRGEPAGFDPLIGLSARLASVPAQAEQRELAQILEELLLELPSEQRQTFTLHHYHSLTLTEVADAMAATLPTTKGRLRLAKEKLRRLLACRGFAAEALSESS